MNKLFVNLILVLCLTTVLAKNLKRTEHADKFMSFVQDHSKKYDSEEERQYRFSVFKDNLKLIDELNKQNQAVFGVNKFADLSEDEFISIFANSEPQMNKKLEYDAPIYSGTSDTSILAQQSKKTILPSSLDLRSTYGANNKVKDQGLCTCSWAFAAASALEYHYWKKTQFVTDLSEQQFLDCSTQNVFFGGSVLTAFQYASNNTLAIESGYKFTGKYSSALCGSKTLPSTSLKLTKEVYQKINPEDTAIREALVKNGVLTACFFSKTLRLYKSGIFNQELTKSDNQQCLFDFTIFGYGTDSATLKNYYLIKNSWGTQWGENGYGKILSSKEVGKASMSGLIYDQIYYPLIA